MKNKNNYRPLRKTDSILVCLASEHGNGMQREYLVLINARLMQEINLANNTMKVYQRAEDEEPLQEYHAWKHGQLNELGYRACSFDKYLVAQDTLHSRLKPKQPASVRLRTTCYRNTPLTGGVVTL